MLVQFLEEYRTEILAFTQVKALKLAGPLLSSEELETGLPLFFEHLILFLKGPTVKLAEQNILVGAAQHGRELLRLGYSLSHVVHAYGAICQAITELAQKKNIKITAKEFNDLNMCLDVAIAAAVSEFQFQSVHASKEREIQHLGFLVHELRNALSSATIASEMIKKGLVGTGGSTAKVLEENLARMRTLIDRSLSELRMRSDPEILIEKFTLNELVDQIILTAQSELLVKRQTIKSQIKHKIELETDRQLLLSAVANLIQNAIKYTKAEGHINITATNTGESVVIEVEDECGGIESDRIANLFKPFTFGGFDQKGLGLGLAIVQRAVNLLQGKISVRNNPNKGCAFLVEIPKKIDPTKPKSKVVQGADSVQPE